MNWANTTSTYKKLFSLHEIERDEALRWFAASLLVSFYIIFASWSTKPTVSLEAITNHTYVCWPFFQNCANIYFLSPGIHNYSQNILFAILLGTMISCAFSFHHKNWVITHAHFLAIFIVWMYFILASFENRMNHNTYITIFALVFLFIPHKKFFASLFVILFYFVSTFGKIHESWTLASYFSNIKLGLPLFPHGTEMLFTNILIMFEMICCWLLFSKNKQLQRSTFTFFVIFHIYSAALAGYNFPTIILPPLIIFFGLWFNPKDPVPLDLKSIPGWLMVAALFMGQFAPKLIPLEDRYTYEGTSYSMFMFSSRHECQIKVQQNGQNIYHTLTTSSSRATSCDPYAAMFRLQNRFCPSPTPLQFKFDHSINGGPFHRIVDEPDLCSLTYKPFGKNGWIKDHTNSPITGHPTRSRPPARI